MKSFFVAALIGTAGAALAQAPTPGSGSSSSSSSSPGMQKDNESSAQQGSSSPGSAEQQGSSSQGSTEQQGSSSPGSTGSSKGAPTAGYAAPMDMTKVGPLSRKVTTPDRNGVEALIRASDKAWMSGDVQAVAQLQDFPVHMSTDDSTGKFKGEEWSRDQFVQMMGDMVSKTPRDITFKHKLTPHFLSDTLAVVVDEPTMMKGNTRLGTFTSVSVVIKKDGRWLFKEGVEAGWGDMANQQTGAAKP
jgi:hypothetical protein